MWQCKDLKSKNRFQRVKRNSAAFGAAHSLSVCSSILLCKQHMMANSHISSLFLSSRHWFHLSTCGKKTSWTRFASCTPLVREFWGSLTDNPRHLKATQKHSITKINLHFVVILTTTFSPAVREAFFWFWDWKVWAGCAGWELNPAQLPALDPAGGVYTVIHGLIFHRTDLLPSALNYENSTM